MTIALSVTVRVIGPTVSRLLDSGNTPRLLILPKVGFSPTMPQADDGIRTEPPVSLPSAAMHCPEETAEPEPPLEPPVMRVVSQGLRAGP